MISKRSPTVWTILSLLEGAIETEIEGDVLFFLTVAMYVSSRRLGYTVGSSYLNRMDDSMNIAEIVKQLKSERESLTKAIDALEGIEGGSQGVATNGSKPTTKAKAAKQPSNGLTSAGRKRLSQLMKKRWADKKKATTAKSK
jgi:hypothetical protein